MLKNITRVYFYYNRIGDSMCRYRLQYNDKDGEWRDKITFLKGENLTTEWKMLDIGFYDEGIVKGVRMIFDEIDHSKSDMGISNINFEFISSW